MHSQDEEPTERDEQPPERAPEPARSRGVGARGLLAAVAIVVLIVFAVVNFRPVEVNFVIFSARARVVTVIVVASALGFVVGYFAGRPSRDERRRLRDARGRD